MNRTCVLRLLLPVCLLSSCGQESTYGEPAIRPEKVTKSLLDFLLYREKYLRLTEEFTALDSVKNVLTRGTFLQCLASGRYFPLTPGTNDSARNYQLYPIPDSSTDIRTTVAQWGEQLYLHYRREGQPFTGLPFRDLNGKLYEKEATQNKIIVLKCWFIGCLPCVKEMPALNQLVEHYGRGSNVLFISLALDKKAALDSFVKRVKFDYAVVPEMEPLIHSLGVTSFPTHILVNTQRKIVRYFQTEKELAVALKNEVANQLSL